MEKMLKWKVKLTGKQLNAGIVRWYVLDVECGGKEEQSQDR